MKAKIEAICASERKGIQKQSLEKALLRKNHGLEGDAHAGNWHRQISLLAREDIDGMRAKGLPNLKAGDFGENLVVSGLNMDDLGLGSQLRVGIEAELAITQIGKVCHDHCAIYAKTGDCIMPRRGLFARILKDGAIKVGDTVEIISAIPRNTFQCVVLTASVRMTAKSWSTACFIMQTDTPSTWS